MAGLSVAPLGGTGDLEPYIWALEDAEWDQQCFRTVFSSLLPFLPEEMLFQVQDYYRLQMHYIFPSGRLFSDGHHVSIGISKGNCVSAS